MTKIIVILTFIPWILYFLSSSSIGIKKYRNKKLNKEFYKENFWTLFRFDNIILIMIYAYFSLTYPNADQIWLIRTLLFVTINIYLFLNSIYDKAHKEELRKKDYKIVYIAILITLIPVIYYLITNHHNITYYIMFLYSVFNGIIVTLCIKLSKFIKKAIKK